MKTLENQSANNDLPRGLVRASTGLHFRREKDINREERELLL